MVLQRANGYISILIFLCHRSENVPSGHGSEVFFAYGDCHIFKFFPYRIEQIPHCGIGERTVVCGIFKNFSVKINIARSDLSIALFFLFSAALCRNHFLISVQPGIVSVIYDAGRFRHVVKHGMEPDEFILHPPLCNSSGGSIPHGVHISGLRLKECHGKFSKHNGQCVPEAVRGDAGRRIELNGFHVGAVHVDAAVFKPEFNDAHSGFSIKRVRVMPHPVVSQIRRFPSCSHPDSVCFSFPCPPSSCPQPYALQLRC